MIALEEEIADCERRSEYGAGKKGFRCIRCGEIAPYSPEVVIVEVQGKGVAVLVHLLGEGVRRLHAECLHGSCALRGIFLRKGWTLSTPSGGTAGLKG